MKNIKKYIPLIIVLVIAGLGFAFRENIARAVRGDAYVDNKIFTKQLEKAQKSGKDAFPQLSDKVAKDEAEVILHTSKGVAMNPDLLLMDEPYGQMDIKLRFYLEDEVVRLWKETGSTVLFITHNIEEAVYLAERILILTNKPTTIKEDFKVDLPRPRDVTSPEFTKIRQYVTDQIKWW